ncbi:EAL domain-containing protein [Clostridium sp. YIM B02505]|uniref:EAL domain-containing protein n=1 Tax=Clostridium yunnanense TaxID=2800325 RepID=A0ABS1EPK8_9CLOT|nr:GGDEF domain-containing phosphodiesterase [Clostridium yunnanense]MBK1811259.1 EAL domain-containing protein [Clostridium yunnanense]
MTEKNMPKTIPGIIKVINESSDMDTIEAMENYLGCYYGVPILIIGSIVNFFQHHELKSSVIDSILMLILGFCFAITPYLKLKTRIITHWVSILFSVVLIFVAIRTYIFIGPAIWTIAAINIIISSARISRVMLNYIIFSTFLVCIYYYLVLSKTSFQSGNTYYILQTILLFLVLIISTVLHVINQSHYKRINKMYMTEVKQREELEKMYDSIAATHEELNYRYNQLNDTNIKLKFNEEKLYHMAHFDMITDLANRKTIIQEIYKLIKLSEDVETSFYIVFIDIDSFKKINDIMGHHIGDLFVKAAADRLKKFIDKDDLIGRIGGDEFALIIDRNIDNEEVYSYLEGIRKEFAKPFMIGNNEIRSSASFGVASFPGDGIEQVELVKNADTAMYKAKELGKNNIQFFESSMKKELLDKINFETKLKSALWNDEIFLVFQPIYSLKEHKIRGFETLVRWQSPELGMVSPATFIPVAEEIGIIISLGEWIIRTACESFKNLQSIYNIDAILSINLSVNQLESPNIIEVIESALKDADLDPKYLEIEVTESILISSIENTTIILEKLREMNVSVALDDFGTGYSSLSYLTKLPIDVLKIDKSFIDDLLNEDKNVEIIGSIISLAHNLGISVVAEGIEEEIQIKHLSKLECDYIQGYFIGKPMKVKELEEYITLVN